jgi:glycosyltransferase involved in cell wall biosynthesis
MLKVEKRILIATPMMPPTSGGPAIHAKKLYEFFRGGSEAAAHVDLFNFEKLNKYPAGVRHVLAFLKIFKMSIGKDIVFALDGFSVALPAVMVGKILRKKVVLRIGGDLVHEQYVENNLVSMDVFYEKLKSGELKLNSKLKIKLWVQKFVNKNASGIIFNTIWQRNMYENFYKFPANIWVIMNPLEKIEDSVLEQIDYIPSSNLTFTSITREVAFKNKKNLRLAIEDAKKMFPDIVLEEKNGGWDETVKKISLSRAYVCVSISDISPNTVLESLSLGIPVIMTKNSGLYEFLKQKNSEDDFCIFVDPFSVADMSNAILMMCNDEKYAGLKRNAINFTNNNLWPQNWKTLCRQYEEIVKNL